MLFRNMYVLKENIGQSTYLPTYLPTYISIDPSIHLSYLFELSIFLLATPRTRRKPILTWPRCHINMMPLYLAL